MSQSRQNTVRKAGRFAITCNPEKKLYEEISRAAADRRMSRASFVLVAAEEKLAREARKQTS